MDAVLLARLQFATTASLHFLFVVLTLGLVTLLVYLQTAWWLTGRPVYGRMVRFWGTLYVINYVLGIGTGIVMEFQFGLTWSGLSHAVGNVFGAPLAVETLLAFALESTFLGMWIFGWQRLPRWLHTLLLWLVAATAYLSAFWIMVANSFLQNPVGHEMRAGVAYLTDPGALLTNPALGFALGHVLSAALTTGGFFLAGVSAWHFLRRTAEVDFFRRSMRLGLTAGVVGVSLTMGFGFPQFGAVGAVQPTKYGDEAERAALIAQWTAAYGPGDYTPPDWTGLPLAVMMGIAFLLAYAVFLLPLLYRDWLLRWRAPHYLLLAALPLPFVAAACGWLVREVGRAPWAAYGLLTARDAATPMSGGTALASLLGFTALVGGLAVANWTLLARHAARGPRDLALGRQPGDPGDDGPAAAPARPLLVAG
ncbi:MAG TPA: cytochrome ubiquinol oxidase subunit I [Pilimelia sp.]|nr:cytochrome ubiquinol oxidase subunit I [Pilimelia sp.]